MVSGCGRSAARCVECIVKLGVFSPGPRGQEGISRKLLEAGLQPAISSLGGWRLIH